MSAAEQHDVIRALVDLADSLVADYEPFDLLQRLVEDCTRLLPVSAAGILLAGRDGRLQVAAASSEQMRTLELIQLQGTQGPCLEAYSRAERVVAGGAQQLRRRWGDFASDVGTAGFRSVAAVPLRLRQQRLGALGLFSTQENVLADEDIDVAQAFADIAAIALLQQQAVQDSHDVSAHLQHALDSRIVNEQAKGIIAAQLGVTVADAFVVLRNHARTRHLPLKQVATDITEGVLNARDLHRRGVGPAPRPPR